MGIGQRNPLNFHLNHHHHHHHDVYDDGGDEDGEMIPKGFVGIRVGEEHRRFVVPVAYVNHPLFMKLLDEAEAEYGFDREGPITIPCHIQEFQHVQGIIHKDNILHHHHHHHHHFLCFGP